MLQNTKSSKLYADIVLLISVVALFTSLLE